jgi:hypothetical protein
MDNYQGPGKYKHYKGDVYEVLGIAMYESTLKPVVVYKPIGKVSADFLSQYDARFWARPLDDFNDQVEIGEFDEGTYQQVPRFARVG